MSAFFLRISYVSIHTAIHSKEIDFQTGEHTYAVLHKL